jgi:undecaprenyl-diphosphatase
MNQQYCAKKQLRSKSVVFSPSIPMSESMPNSTPNSTPTSTPRRSPAQALSLSLTLGLALILLSAWAFGTLAEDVVTHARITLLDARLAAWFHAHATPAFTRVMRFVSTAGGLAGTSLMGALLAVWFWRRRLRGWLLVTLVAVPGGLLLNVLLKHAFHRVRPSFPDPLVTLETYSFPSGHAMASTVFFGLLGCFLAQRLRSVPARALAVGACVAMVVLVAVSRLYLGAHYLSDVLAGAAEGCAWLATCFTAVSAWGRRRAQLEPRA